MFKVTDPIPSLNPNRALPTFWLVFEKGKGNWQGGNSQEKEGEENRERRGWRREGSNPISALNVHETQKFSQLKGNRGRGTRW